MPAIPKYPQPAEPEPEKASVNDWAGTPAGRAAFWANAGSLGLDDTAAHEALGCDSIYEFPGDLGDAFSALANFAAPKTEAGRLTTDEDEGQESNADQRGLARRYAESCRGLPESPVLVWTQFQLGLGRPTHTISMRPQLEPELMGYGVSLALKLAAQFDATLEERKGFPVYRSTDVPGLPSHDKKPAAPAEKPLRDASAAPKAEAAPALDDGSPDPAWCSLHDCEMKRRTKDGQVWYSHKLPDGSWCNGKA